MKKKNRLEVVTHPLKEFLFSSVPLLLQMFNCTICTSLKSIIIFFRDTSFCFLFSEKIIYIFAIKHHIQKWRALNSIKISFLKGNDIFGNTIISYVILYHLVDKPKSLAMLRRKCLEKERADNNTFAVCKTRLCIPGEFLIPCTQRQTIVASLRSGLKRRSQK